MGSGAPNLVPGPSGTWGNVVPAMVSTDFLRVKGTSARAESRAHMRAAGDDWTVPDFCSANLADELRAGADTESNFRLSYRPIRISKLFAGHGRRVSHDPCGGRKTSRILVHRC